MNCPKKTNMFFFSFSLSFSPQRVTSGLKLLCFLPSITVLVYFGNFFSYFLVQFSFFFSFLAPIFVFSSIRFREPARSRFSTTTSTPPSAQGTRPRATRRSLRGTPSSLTTTRSRTTSTVTEIPSTSPAQIRSRTRRIRSRLR